MELLDRARQLFPDVSWRVALDNLPFSIVICWAYVRSCGGLLGKQSRVLLQDGVLIVALDHKSHEPYVVHQQRITGSGIVDSIEFPGGFQDEGEDILAAGLRELWEECRVKPTEEATYHPLFLNKNPFSGSVITQVHAYLVTSAERTEEAHDEEIDSVATMPLSQIISRRYQEVMPDPLKSFLLALLVKQKLQEQQLDHLIT